MRVPSVVCCLYLWAYIRTGCLKDMSRDNGLVFFFFFHFPRSYVVGSR